MAKLLLGISGRVEAGETLSAVVYNTGTGTSALTGFSLQWQVFNGTSWNNTGSANATSLVIPNNSTAIGLSYRLVATPTAAGNEAGTSAETSAAIQDKSGARAPTLADVATSLTLAENAAATLLDSAVTFNDQDNSNYGGGSLTILNTNGDGQDVLSVRNQGTGAGQVSFNAATGQVFYSSTAGSPVLIGQVDGALDGDGTDLKIVFNTSATKAMVDRLIENLQFANNDDSPTGTRLITVKVGDPTGGTVQRVVQVNVTAAADAPVMTGAASFTADENQSIAGTVSAVDPDLEATAAQGITYSLVAGAGSTDNALFALDAASGALTFVAPPDFEGTHGPGYSVRVRASDGNGGTVEQVLSILLRNVNEGPAASNLAAAAPEDGPAVTVQPVYSDPDAGDTHTLTLGTTGTAGAVAIVNGQFQYNAAGAFEQLRAGESATDSFSYTVTDAGGLAVTRSVTVTVQGSNDAAAIAGAGSGNVTEDGQLSASGQLTVADVDSGENHLVLSDPAQLEGHLGQFVVTEGGQWSYSVDNALLQSLSAGQTRDEVLDVRSADGTAASQLRVTLHGVNDAPQITGGQDAGEVRESGVFDNGQHDPGVGTVDGTLLGYDPDTGDSLSWSGAAAGTYGYFQLNPATGYWWYMVDHSLAAVQALAEGQSAVERFTMTVTDSQGATAQREVVITVRGSNDFAIVSNSSQWTGSVTEDSGANGTATGSLILAKADPDQGDTGQWSGGGQGTYGQLQITPQGQWTYALDNSRGALNLLGAGQTATENFTVTLADGYGASEQRQVSVTVTGTNETPWISGEWAGQVVAAGEAVSATGKLDAHDWDPDGTLLFGGNAAGSYGTFAVDAASGAWTYSTDPAAAATLAAGQQAVETFTVTLTDGYGASMQGDVSITVTGRNEAPTSDGGPVAVALSEDGSPFAQGDLDAGDVDSGDLLTWSGSLVGYWGTFTIDPATGEWNYANSALVQELNALESSLETFTATVTDSHGAIAERQVTFTVQGANDLPVIGADPAARSGSVTEAGASGSGVTTTGNTLQAWDVDRGSTLSWSGSASGAYGSFAIDATTGAWSYTLDNVAAQALAAGTVATETFTAAVNDTSGGTAQAQVTISVTGANDQPTVAGGNAAATVAEDGTATAQGQFVASDADSGDSTSWSGNATGVYGAFTLDSATGQWNYALDNAGTATQALRQGQSATETFTATVTDSQGATVQREVAITVIGTNDLPVVSGTSQLAGTVEEDTTAAAGGTLLASDADAGETLVWSGGGTGAYGQLTLTPQGGWSYALDNAAAQALAEGQVVTEIFAATVTDAVGATAQAQLTITVTGDNDAPAIAGGNGAGSVTEDGAATAQGQFSSVDADAGDSAAWSGGANGTYGTFAVDAATGQWTYTLDNSRSATQALAQGQAVNETFTATVTDSQGATAQRQVTLTIAGTNDAPLVSATSQRTGAVQEDGSASAAGVLAASDADGGETLVWSGGGTGAYGQLTLTPQGGWSYALDNAAAQALAEGQSVTEVFAATVTDAAGATAQTQLTITVSGDNDAPAIAGNAAGNVVEAGQLDDGTATPGQASVQGALTGQDADSGEALSWSGSAAGLYGEFSIDAATGLWTYALDNARAATQALAESESAVERFTATLTDSQGATAQREVTLTVTGANDAPVANGGLATGSVTEDAGAPAQGQLTATDADGGAALAWSGSRSGVYGNFSIDTTGLWTYALDNSRAVTQALAQGQTVAETFTATVTDVQGASAQREVTITVAGANDFPGFAASSQLTGAVREDGTSTATGSLYAAGADPDQGDQLTFSGGGNGMYGQLTVTPQGTWTYTLDNSRQETQWQWEGRVVTETFAVRLADRFGAFSYRDVTITLTGTNDVPVISSATVDTGTVQAGSAVSTDGQVWFPQGQTGYWEPAPGFASAMDASGRLLVLSRNYDGEVMLMRLNADGSSDTSFGADGSAYVSINLLQNVELAVDPATGKIAVVGNMWMGGGDLDYFIYRFLDDGRPDLTVGPGWGQNNFNVADAEARSVAFDASGRMVVTGYSSFYQAPVVARLTDAGDLDTSFGNRGKLIFGGESDGAYLADHTVVMDASGRFWMWGHTTDPNNNYEIEVRVFRYLADGSRDLGFATDGEFQFDDPLVTSCDLALTPDGGFVLAWVDQQNLAGAAAVLHLIRYDSTGRPRPGFGDASSHVQYTIGNYQQEVTVELDAQGRLLVGAATAGAERDMMLLRLLPDGSLDTSFGTNGVVANDFVGRSDYVREIHVAPDGGIVLAGLSTEASGSDRMISFQGLQSDGSVDPQFGGLLDDRTGGVLAATDVDLGSSLTWSGSAEGLYGTLTVARWGQWSYEVDNSRPATLAIGAGQSATDSFTVSVSDGRGGVATREVVVTVVGAANEAPEIYVEPGSLEGHVVDPTVEQPGLLSATGTLGAYDPNTGDSLTWSGSAASPYGYFHVDAATGTWTYALDPVAADPLRQFDGRVETFTMTVSDGRGGTDTETVTINIHGDNDAPVPQQGSGDTGTVLTAPATDGTLVHDFGNDGVLSGAHLLAVDGQGRILLQGNNQGTTLLERLNADGGVDKTFGSKGVVTLPGGESLYHAAVDPVSGAIVMSGQAFGAGGFYDYALRRVLPDGSTDTSFGSDGRVLIDIGGVNDQGANVMFTGDGDMLVAGSAQMEGDSVGPADLVLVRLNADGSLDTGFGNGGRWVFEGDGSGYTGSHEVTMDAFGRLLVWGVGNDSATGGYELQVFRFDANGNADLSFGTDGRFELPLYGGSYPSATLATAADGSVALGWADHYSYSDQYWLNLVRLDADGQLDAGFGYGGRFHESIGEYPWQVGLAIDGTGALLVGGSVAGSQTGEDMMVLRVLPDGSIDANFAGGMATADLGGHERPDGLHLSSAGILLVGPQSEAPLFQSSDIYTGLVRFNTDGTLDTGFGVEADAKVSGQLAAVDPEGDGWVMWSTEGSYPYELAGTYGSLSLQPWGAWTYTVDNSLPTTQALAPGQSATDVFTVRVADNSGVGTTQEVVVTIVGNGPAAP